MQLGHVAPRRERAQWDRRDHGVEFYDSDASLIDAVVGFVAPQLAEGVAVVVATPGHRDRVGRALEGTGIDVSATVRRGRLVMLDASDTLEQFMVDGAPDRRAFHAVIGGVLDAAARVGGPVRVYGEMVAVLWEQGRVAATMLLEGLWNELAGSRAFGLLCGYPSTLFAHPASLGSVATLCGQHTAVTVPPDEHFTRLASGAGGSRGGEQRAVRWRLPADPVSGAQARRQLRELLLAWQLPHLLDETELLATELISNAVVHARSRMLVSVTQRHGEVRVEVTDLGAGAFHRRESDLEGLGGRGLLLVEAMSSAWGTEVEGESNTVWFELPDPAAVDGSSGQAVAPTRSAQR